MTGPILAIETSCDETAAALVTARGDVRSSIVSSQIDLHAHFGGVVPELASRAHLELIDAVIEQAMVEAGVTPDELSAVAATAGPGLIGALLVGVSAAKIRSVAWDVPYVAVNHLEGHLFATTLERPDLEPPLVVLLVSGGHTMIVGVNQPGQYRILGSTVDDAAGEAYDKVARFLGLGYPGGPLIDSLAASGDPDSIRFPRAMSGDGLDFSFSGLKTAVINHVRRHPEVTDADVAASFQAAVCDVLVDKTMTAAKRFGARAVCLGGGVAANSRLRTQFASAADAAGLDRLIPDRAFCTDNAAMIAAAAHWRLENDGPTPLDAGARSSWPLDQLSG